MSDLQDAPRLPDSYQDYRGNAEDEAAYAQARARLGQAQLPGGEGGGQTPAPGQQEPADQATPQTQQQAQGQPQRVAANMPSLETVQAEVERLAAPPFDKSRYANPEEALRDQALKNLGVEQPPEPPPTTAQKIGNVAESIGAGALEGAVESPRATYKGVHDAIKSVLNLAADVNDWQSSKFSSWHMDAMANLTKQFGTSERALGQRFDVAEPSSAVGIAVKNVAQFTTGMALGGAELRAIGLPTNLAGWAGRGVTAAQGFLAQFESFDGAQHRLSDLIQSVPSLRNPVTEFLSSKPDDTQAEGRLKNAVEGSVVGQAADGIIGGIRMLRGAISARTEAQSLVDAAAAKPPPVPAAGMEALGDVSVQAETPTVDVDMARFSATPAAQTKLTEAAAKTEGMTAEETSSAQAAAQPAININFARIDTPDDVKDTMQSLADKFSGDINAARRGVQTFQDTQLGAQSEDAWKTLMERRVGDPLNDTQSLAARQLWVSSAAKTKQLADIAVQSPSVENLYAFRKMLVTHAAIQEQVIAARTETARALSSWRIPAGDAPMRLESMVAQLSQDAGLKGGAETALTLAQKVREAATAGDWNAVTAITEKGALAKTRDAALEAWTNGLLTAPLTHVKVIASNTATMVQRIAERAVASRISSVLGDQNGVAMGEASAQVSGLVGGLQDAFRFAGKLARGAFTGEAPALGEDPLSNAIKAAKSGQYSLEANAGSEYMQNAGAISSETLGMADGGWVGNSVDLLGQLVRSPGRALTAEHDFFRSIGYRMELNAQALRQATQEVNSGGITKDALGSRVAEIIANPPPQVKMAAVDGTLYQTFTDAPGKLAEHIGQLRSEFPLLRVILPFYKIPSRILSFGFERSPLAPLMSTFRQNIAAGGARQSLALAQMGLGTAAMLATADHFMSGKLTGSGPQDPSERAQLENEGWQPYSIQVGGKWMQYNRIEPAGSTMAMAADAMDAMRNFHSQVNGDDPDTANLGLALVASVANDITSKSYLSGLANFFDAIADPKSNGRKAIDALAGSAVPAGVAAIDRMTDPYKREVYRMIDAIKSRTPGLSEGQAPEMNLWGEPVQNASGMGKAFDLLSPVGTRPAANEPIDRELLKQGISLSRVPSRTALNGVTLDLNRIDPKIYARYQALAGNAYKGPDGMGLKDALNALVTGQHPYSPVYDRFGPQGDGPDGPKADMIRDVVNEYRNGAKGQLMQEYPQLTDMVREGQRAKQQLRSGALQ